jgi:hypothetical protein
MNGAWHGAAVHEFRKDREWTGAPLLTSYPDWIPEPGQPRVGRWPTTDRQKGDPVHDDRRRSPAPQGRADPCSSARVVTARLTSTASHVPDQNGRIASSRACLPARKRASHLVRAVGGGLRFLGGSVAMS